MVLSTLFSGFLLGLKLFKTKVPKTNGKAARFKIVLRRFLFIDE
jgi:hypothetical protein